jgi:hypothetical protein
MPRAAFIFRMDTDLKFCTTADNDPGWVPFGRPRCGGVRRGEKSFAPTGFGDNDNSMHVIGHDNKRIQFNDREMVWDILPTTPGDFASIIQPHFSIRDLAEETRPIPRADRHEICPTWQG